MPYRAWLHSRAILWSCVLLLPPAGLVLIWMRRDLRLWLKIMDSLIAMVCLVLHLSLFWGFRMEMDGGMRRPIFSFRSARRHDREIEMRRRVENSVDASAIAAAQQVAAPTGETAKKTDPAKVAQPGLKATAANSYWTDFRGPGRAGIYAAGEIFTEWPASGLPLLWRRPVGGGYASVVVADGMLFTIEQRRAKEVVAAYDLSTGREKWIHGWDAEFRETLGGDGPRATPVWDEGRLYALGATGEFRCLDAESGTRIWSHSILAENGAENLPWGMAASPLIVDDKVIVLPGGPDGRSVAAYNKITGAPVWRALSDRQAYVSPQLVTLADRRQLIVVSGSRVTGLGVENGALLWEYPWATQNGINTAQPIVTAAGRFFISAAYDHGAALVEVGARGDRLEAHTVWQTNRMKNKFASSVLYKGFIYGLDEAILACIDASTGELKWKGGRYGYGQLLLASGHLIISAENGDVVLVKASPESHEEIARFHAIDGKTWNVPALADGKLIVRNSSEMACFRVGK